jgi:hypothetical protein
MFLASVPIVLHDPAPLKLILIVVALVSGEPDAAEPSQ